jgi:hypothetical protein
VLQVYLEAVEAEAIHVAEVVQVKLIQLVVEEMVVVIQEIQQQVQPIQVAAVVEQKQLQMEDQMEEVES